VAEPPAGGDTDARLPEQHEAEGKHEQPAASCSSSSSVAKVPVWLLEDKAGHGER